MKSFAVVPAVALAGFGMLAAPRTAHAQWVKDNVRIKNWPTGENALQVEGDSSCSPASGTDNPLVLKAESKRLDNEGYAWVNNLTYQAVQRFNWSFAIQGPPAPTFYTDVTAVVSGEAGPWRGSVPSSETDAEKQIGDAYSSIGVGGVSGFASNSRDYPDGTKLSFEGSNYQRTSQVQVHYQTNPTADIYHASLAINMGATTNVAPAAVRTSGGGNAGIPASGGPAKRGSVCYSCFVCGKYTFFRCTDTDYVGKASHAKCDGTLAFGNPYQ